MSTLAPALCYKCLMTHRLSWEENGKSMSGLWITESTLAPPKRLLVADDSLKADTYYRMASEGGGFLWRGDYQNAKQLLQAAARRIEKQAAGKKTKPPQTPAEGFHRYRQAQAHRAQLLSKLLIQVEADLTIKLSRAPDVKQAISQAVSVPEASFLLSLKDLLAFIGALEWHKKGVEIPALGAKIHPCYGTFSPVRGEYIDLVANAPLPNATNLAFEIGTGTGVLAALLAKRGFEKVVATEIDERALHCAKENLRGLGFDSKIELVRADLFPPGKADLIVCNPPWIPAKATSPLERAVYDEDSRMLKGFLKDAAVHLRESGEVWLIISDLAEHLGLRKPEDIPTLIENAGLKIIDRLEARPRHSKAADVSDPLFEARSKEITRLWRFKARS